MYNITKNFLYFNEHTKNPPIPPAEPSAGIAIQFQFENNLTNEGWAYDVSLVHGTETYVTGKVGYGLFGNCSDNTQTEYLPFVSQMFKKSWSMSFWATFGSDTYNNRNGFYFESPFGIVGMFSSGAVGWNNPPNGPTIICAGVASHAQWVYGDAITFDFNTPIMHTMVLNSDTNRVYFYLNNILVYNRFELTYSCPITNPTTFFDAYARNFCVKTDMGDPTGSHQSATGNMIDQCRVYNKLLTQTDIDVLYNNGSGM